MFFSYLGSMPRSILFVVTPNSLIVMLLIPSHHHLNLYRLTDFLSSPGQVVPRTHQILFFPHHHFLHLLRGHNLLPPLPSPTDIRPSPLIAARHVLSLYPPSQLSNHSPPHVHGTPKLRVEMNGTEDP